MYKAAVDYVYKFKSLPTISHHFNIRGKSDNSIKIPMRTSPSK